VEQTQENKDISRSRTSSPPKDTPFINAFVSIGLLREGLTKVQGDRDLAKSILQHGNDLKSKLQALLGRDSISSYKTENFFTQNQDIQQFYRLITDLAMADLKFEDWKQSVVQVLGESMPPSEKRRNCAELLVCTKRECERTSQWTAFPGPLCYSLEQLLAESVPSLTRESLSLSAQLHPCSTNLSPYEQAGVTTNARYSRLIQNFSIEEMLTKQPFKGISSKSCLFL
jgi:hypothetical protein